MQKRILILAAVLAFPAIAVIAWMLVTVPRSPVEDSAAERIPQSDVRASVPQSARTMVTATATNSGAPGIARRSDDDFSAPAPVPAPATVLPADPAPFISPRYTLTTQPNAAALARRLANHPPLAPDERIRVVPAEIAAPRAASASNQTEADSKAILLRLDPTLHDPVAWFEDEKPLNETKADVKARIAGEFAAEVAAAAKQPETAGGDFDATWKDARAKANWEYQKFFGGDAANRAAVNAGRSAQPRQ